MCAIKARREASHRDTGIHLVLITMTYATSLSRVNTHTHSSQSAPARASRVSEGRPGCTTDPGVTHMLKHPWIAGAERLASPRGPHVSPSSERVDSREVCVPAVIAQRDPPWPSSGRGDCAARAPAPPLPSSHADQPEGTKGLLSHPHFSVTQPPPTRLRLEHSACRPLHQLTALMRCRLAKALHVKCLPSPPPSCRLLIAAAAPRGSAYPAP